MATNGTKSRTASRTNGHKNGRKKSLIDAPLDELFGEFVDLAIFKNKTLDDLASMARQLGNEVLAEGFRSAKGQQTYDAFGERLAASSAHDLAASARCAKEPPASSSAVARPITQGKAESIRDGFVVITDLLGELSATLHNLAELKCFEDEDGLVAGKINRLFREVWRLRWDVGPNAGEVETTYDAATHATNGAEHAEGSAES